MPLVFIAAALVVLVVLSGLIWVSWGLIGLALHLFMAGLVGSWLGPLIVGPVGPSLFGVPLIPGFVGALILAFALSLLTRLRTA